MEWENLTDMAAGAEGGQATNVKRSIGPKLCTNYALLEKIKETNQRLVETEAEIIEEDIIVPNVTPIAEGGVKENCYQAHIHYSRFKKHVI